MTYASTIGPARAPRDSFRLLWSASALSTLGSAFSTFALPLLVYKLTRSPLSLGVAFACTYLPYPLLGLYIGAWADRVDRLRLSIVTDVVRAVLIGSVAFAYWTDTVTMPWVYAVMTLSSTMTIAFTCAQSALLPSLVPADRLLPANARLQMMASAAQVIGPILAGGLLTVLEVGFLFVADAVSFCLSAALLGFIRVPAGAATQAARPESSLTRDVGDGLAYVLRHPLLRTISIMTASLSFLGATIEAQIVLFSAERLRMSESEIGLVFAAGALGIVAASLVSARWGSSGGSRHRIARVLIGSATAKGVCMLVLGVTRNVPLALACWAGSEGLAILYSLHTTALRQRIVPRAMLGRVDSIAQVFAWGRSSRWGRCWAAG